MQKFLSAKQKKEEQRLVLERQAYLEEVLRQAKEADAKAQADAITDQEIVDSFFNFLPLVSGGQESPGLEVQYLNILHIFSMKFCTGLCKFLDFLGQNFDGKRMVIEEIDIDDLPMEDEPLGDDDADLDEYSFSKFASMYFQGAATATHIRQKLRQPLLYHEDGGDILVLLFNCWNSSLC